MERSEQPVLLGVIKHPAKAERDTFDEIVSTLQHLYKRRLRPNPGDKTVAKRRTAYLTGITSRDFHDVFRQYNLFSRLGCVQSGRACWMHTWEQHPAAHGPAGLRLGAAPAIPQHPHPTPAATQCTATAC